ncbi:pantetheine-phosphate adenylyltransferase [Selenomonas caprae]|uniref:Phosphopantetheine adenylyltransferase n=2 Tax=Selenomonas TaxID=970 RepID=A0A1I3FSK2_SELRU|nr:MULTISPECIES: pantetheine-phosphate adenylyltransferase [Selenomonas]MBQ1890532.1 pantetheine-phosphate adenylyltransferase [Selenomonas sp.]TYZ28332.1 pantetheine-phosphate adenylyltransferase [Selenomonas caprae]SFI14179.1 Phosphopantetheine adenylyltransferase [Selenomonas ruminantium]
MTRAVCSGSFDPVTNGHVDVFERASRMFDELIICVFQNASKKGFLPVEQRVDLLRQAVSHLENVQVMSFAGLITEFMRAHDAQVIVRGIRSVKDLEYEENEAYMIRHIAPEIDTVFLLTRPDYSYVSSSGVRELFRFHGSVHGLVPDCVEQAMIELEQRERK